MIALCQAPQQCCQFGHFLETIALKLVLRMVDFHGVCRGRRKNPDTGIDRQTDWDRNYFIALVELLWRLWYKRPSRFAAPLGKRRLWLVVRGRAPRVKSPSERGLCLPGSEANDTCFAGCIAPAGENRWLCLFFDNLVVVRVASVVEADRLCGGRLDASLADGRQERLFHSRHLVLNSEGMNTAKVLELQCLETARS